MGKNLTRILALLLCFSIVVSLPVMAVSTDENLALPDSTSENMVSEDGDIPVSGESTIAPDDVVDETHGITADEMSDYAAGDMGDESRDISVADITATAGDEHATSGVEGPASNVLDSDPNTIWHTNWNGTAVENLWLDFDLGGPFRVDGLRYLPRGGAGNGTITSYEILYSRNGTDYFSAGTGTWAKEDGWKAASFMPVVATHIKLRAVASVGSSLGSGAEVRITGEAYTPAPDYSATFDNEDSRGGWKKNTDGQGDGTIAFTDSADAGGYMTLSADVVANGNTAFFGGDSPSLKDGYVEADITPVGINEKFALLFRYQDATHYAGISYDNYSHWNWCSNGGTGWGEPSAALNSTPVPKAGEKLHLRVEFTGENIRVLVDGEEIFLGAIPSLDMDAGRMGIRVWGDLEHGGGGQVQVDNVKMGELDHPVVLPPKPEAETDTNGNYTVTFTDPARRGDWQKNMEDTGTGILTFTNGTAAAGYMEIHGSGTTGNTAYFDESSPRIADGFVQADITPVDTNGRFALAYRYTDATHYTAVSYDAGSWGWCANGGDKWGSLTNLPGGYSPKAGEKFTLRLEFSGASVQVLANGNQVASGTINDSAVSQAAGHMGFRLWGDGADNTRGHLKVDNTTTGMLPVDESDSQGNYMVSFTDAQRRGGFQLSTGDGTVTFHDGAGDDGYATLAKVDEKQTKATAIVTRAPVTADGFLEADVTNLSGGRLGLILRAQGNDKYVGVVYDVGSWAVTKNGNNLTTFDAGGWNSGVKKHFRIEYAGTRLTIYIDGTKVFNQKLDGLADTGSGRVGAIVWGYSSGGNQGKLKLDNVVVGQTVAVELTPGSVSLPYSTAGTQDIMVRLGETVESNPLASIKNGETALAAETDYTITDGNIVTLKKALLTNAVKDAGGLNLTFVFTDGYTTEFELGVQAKPQEHQINYVRDFGTDPMQGENPFALLSGSGTLNYNAEDHTLRLVGGQNAFLVDQSAPDLKNCDVEFTFNMEKDSGSFAAVARYISPDDYAGVGTTGPGYHHDLNWQAVSPNGSATLVVDGGTVFAHRDMPYKVRVRFLEKTATIWMDDAEVWSGDVDKLTGGAGKAGILVRGGATMIISDFRVTSVDSPTVETETGTPTAIASDTLSVRMDGNFPRVIDYTMDSKTLGGQELPYYVVELNNKEYHPVVTPSFTADTATYRLDVEVGPDEHVTFDVVFHVAGNTLQMKLNNIDDTAMPVHNFNFPVHSLVSVSSEQAGAELRAANYSTSEVRKDLTVEPAGAIYNSASIVVISCNDLAATVNNESWCVGRGISYQTFQANGHTTTGLWSTGFLYRGLDGEIMAEEPWVKVAVTGDRNSDGRVDFQDAAIARREDCLKDGGIPNAQHSDAVMGRLNTIAMDVGSAAQYPFLRILDNVKKLSLGIDGFPQTITIKGYNGQGHDSNNNDFANYNEAAGGLEDFNVLLDNAAEYNTKIAVHVNETEAYPESKTYGKLATGIGGWPWYDVANTICRENDALDKSEDGFAARMQQLHDDTNGKLSMIYVDVYYATRWPLYAFVNKVNSLGMAVSTEYANEVDQRSVWAHHVGGNVTQDNIAGNLLRFVNSTTQDIFGGSDLFRNSGDRNNLGINGWQSSYNYDNTLKAFFTSVLPNRFLTQYPIMKWTDTNQATLGENLNVVTKMVNGKNVITLDGNMVADGNLIFIPCTVDGEEKIYHWNPSGGNSIWTLPETFEGQTEVKVFRLSDHGRTDEKTVRVSGGQVTINAQANTGYVIYKGGANVSNTDLTEFDWGQGGVKDAGFDSFTPGYAWTMQNAVFQANDRKNTYLVMSGETDGSATQTITGLTPGAQYQASVWAEVRDKTAQISVTPNGGEPVSNYMDHSNVIYGIHHTDKYKRYLQRMWVDFTASGDGTAVLTLSGMAGKDAQAYVHFDDVRIVEHTPSALQGHDVFEDFENTTEGYGPFVSTESDQTHLSETNLPYTVDTISGRYSLKTRAGDYVRTLPHTLRLSPNAQYTIGLEYKSGAANQNVFTLAVKSDKAREASDTENALVAAQVCGADIRWSGSADSVKRVTLSFTTGPYDDYYIDITKGAVSEYCVDNFYVDEVKKADKDSLQALYDVCTALMEEDYTADSWMQFTAKCEAANTVLTKPDASDQEVQTAQDELQAAKDALVAYAKEADRTRLQNVIDEMKALNPADYKPDSAWTTLQDKIAEAEALKDQQGLTIPQVDAMIAALRAAKAALNTVVDKSKLQALYTICSAISQNDVVDGSELQAFLSARTGAEAALQTDGKTQDEVNAAEKALADAYAAIVPKRTTNEGHVDAPIVVALAEKLAAAKEVAEPSTELSEAIALAEKALTWKEVAEAISTLEDAMREPTGSLTGTVSISGTLKFGEELTATVSDDNNTGVLSYQWKRENANIGTGLTYTTMADDIGQILTCVVTSSVETGSISGVTGTIDKADGSAAPSGITSDACTTAANNDGKIHGVTAAMEYKLSTAEEDIYTACTGTEVTGLANGTYNIRFAETATAKASNFIQVTVDAYGEPASIPVTNVSLSTSNVRLYSNTEPRTAQLTATVTPADATNNAITWASSDPSVVTVDAVSGLVTAVSNGTATVTVTTTDRGFTAQCTITVTTYSYSPSTPSISTTTEKNPDGSTTKTVTDRNTGTVTKTTTYPDGKVVEAITKKDGTVNQTVTEADGKKIATATTPEGDKSITVTNKDGKRVADLELPAVVPAPQESFLDVPDDHWSKEAVDLVAGMGLFTGTGEGTFSGDLSMTRGMFTAVLHRLSGALPGGENSFQDVSQGAWYADSASWAANNGIVTGVSSSSFAPEQSITRESMAVMLYRYAGVLGLDTTFEGDKLADFSDGADVSSWAHDAMGWAVNMGLIQGSNHALNVNDTATRAEVAVMLQRFVELLKK